MATTTDTIAKAFLGLLIFGIVSTVLMCMLLGVGLWGLAVTVPIALIGFYLIGRWMKEQVKWWRFRHERRELRREIERMERL